MPWTARKMDRSWAKAENLGWVRVPYKVDNGDIEYQWQHIDVCTLFTGALGTLSTDYSYTVQGRYILAAGPLAPPLFRDGNGDPVRTVTGHRD